MLYARTHGDEADFIPDPRLVAAIYGKPNQTKAPKTTAALALFDTTTIRTNIDDAQNPWFCMQDVCEKLGVSFDEQPAANIPDSLYIDEEDLCRMIYRTHGLKSKGAVSCHI